MLDRILAAIDPSRESARALRLAIELAREIGADLKVIIVLKPLPACFSFAVPAVFAHAWKHANSQKCSALHSHAKQQMNQSGNVSGCRTGRGQGSTYDPEMRQTIPGRSDRDGVEKPHDRDGSYYSGCGRAACGVLGVPWPCVRMAPGSCIYATTGSRS